jgi:hypothetical protein
VILLAVAGWPSFRSNGNQPACWLCYVFRPRRTLPEPFLVAPQRRIGLANRLSRSRHLQWAFSRRSCAAFLCLYFSLQALLFVKRTLSSSSLIGAAGFVTKGNAVAELTRKVIAEKITIDRIIYGFPHMTGDARRRSRALSRIANIVGLHSADFHRAPTPEVRAKWQDSDGAKSKGFTNVRFTIAVE